MSQPWVLDVTVILEGLLYFFISYNILFNLFFQTYISWFIGSWSPLTPGPWYRGPEWTEKWKNNTPGKSKYILSKQTILNKHECKLRK